MSKTANYTINLITSTGINATSFNQKSHDIKICEAFDKLIKKEKTLKNEDFKSDFLESAAHSYILISNKTVIDKDKLVELERSENLRYYRRCKDEIQRNFARSYIIIAKGKIQAVGESYDDVKDVAVESHHRFIFKVESENIRGNAEWHLWRR